MQDAQHVIQSSTERQETNMQLLFLCLMSLLMCPAAARTVMEALVSRFDLITFTNFLRRVNLDKVLDSGNHMVLVPTDQAFNRVPENVMSLLYGTKQTNNSHLLLDLMKYHIVPYTGQLTTHWTGEKVATLLPTPVRIVTLPKGTIVNSEVMKDSNLTASNGHIYLVDGFLSPPQGDIYTNLLGDDRFSTFLSAVGLAGMRDKLKEDNITILAPTNEAFSLMNPNKSHTLFNSHSDLQALVQFHVLPGLYYVRGLPIDTIVNVNSIKGFNVQLHIRTPFVNRVTIQPGNVPVAQSDWLATNGVIHVIERVIQPSVKCTPRM